MNITVNERNIKVKSYYSEIFTKRKDKHQKYEYIVKSHLFADKPLNEYEKEKLEDEITIRINGEWYGWMKEKN